MSEGGREIFLELMYALPGLLFSLLDHKITKLNEESHKGCPKHITFYIRAFSIKNFFPIRAFSNYIIFQLEHFP